MRNKKGQFVKGFPHNRGIKRNEAFKEMHRRLQTGKKHSDETKRKMSLIKKGKKLSEKHIESLKESQNSGKFIKGNNYSKETEFQKSSIPWNRGLTGYTTSLKGRKFLSRSGKNHFAWKGGIKKRGKGLLFTPLYREWRMSIFKRDNYKCRIADENCKGCLEAHHILPWRDFTKLRYQINNGITLCHFHHPRKRSEETKLSPYFQELVAEIK